MGIARLVMRVYFFFNGLTFVRLVAPSPNYSASPTNSYESIEFINVTILAAVLFVSNKLISPPVSPPINIHNFHLRMGVCYLFVFPIRKCKTVFAVGTSVIQ